MGRAYLVRIKRKRGHGYLRSIIYGKWLLQNVPSVAYAPQWSQLIIHLFWIKVLWGGRWLLDIWQSCSLKKWYIYIFVIHVDIVKVPQTFLFMYTFPIGGKTLTIRLEIFFEQSWKCINIVTIFLSSFDNEISYIFMNRTWMLKHMRRPFYVLMYNNYH